LIRNSGYNVSMPVSRCELACICIITCFLISYPQVKAETLLVARSDSTDLSCAKEDKWLGSDKFAHFTLSLFVSAISYKMYHDNYYNKKTPSILFSGGFTLTLGLGKECYDNARPNKEFGYRDLVADVLGIGVGLILAANH